jgi:hypothetical protein
VNSLNHLQSLLNLSRLKDLVRSCVPGTHAPVQVKSRAPRIAFQPRLAGTEFRGRRL